MSFPIIASPASGDNTTPYAKMSGINRLITALQRTVKNSPSKARGSTRRGVCVSLLQSHFLQRPYYKVDSYIFIYLLSHSNYSRQYKNAE